jgi:hypothetical protein
MSWILIFFNINTGTPQGGVSKNGPGPDNHAPTREKIRVQNGPKGPILAGAKNGRETPEADSGQKIAGDASKMPDKSGRTGAAE